MDPVRVVEAVLYSSSEPISISEIVMATDLSPSQVRKALKTLIAEYNERESAIEIVKIRTRYSMQLRKEYHDYATPFAERELPDSVLRVAAMIAYHQPLLQSDLAKMLGTDVYESVRTLRSMGLIAARKKGQTLELRTTRRFLEYFGIAGSTQEDIRKWMESQVNKSEQK